MFVQGALPGRIDGWTYPEDYEDFTKGTFLLRRINRGSISDFKTQRNSTYGFSTSSSHCSATLRRTRHWTPSFAPLRLFSSSTSLPSTYPTPRPASLLTISC